MHKKAHINYTRKNVVQNKRTKHKGNSRTEWNKKKDAKQKNIKKRISASKTLSN